jgi:hypothetical protein
VIAAHHVQLCAWVVADVAMIDNSFRKRAQSVLAVDAMIGKVAAGRRSDRRGGRYLFRVLLRQRLSRGRAPLDAGQDDRLRLPTSMCRSSSPGPACQRGRTVEEIVQNIDLCPTFAELGFATTPANVDGRSLAPLLRGEKVEEWRTVALVEHRGPIRNLADPDLPDLRNAPRIYEAIRGSGNPPTYEAIRTRIRRWREGIPRPRGGFV